jgi:hypothetical protein
MNIEFEELGNPNDWLNKKLIVNDTNVDYEGELNFTIHYDNHLNHDVLLNKEQVAELIMHLEEHLLKQI